MFRVVVADDEPLLRSHLCRSLEKISYIRVVGQFSNGEQVLLFMQEQAVDVVIADIRMPIMDGLKLAAEIQKRYASCSVILLSGYKEFDYAQQAIRYGVYAYLTKAITKNDLPDTFSRLRQERIADYERILFNTNPNDEQAAKTLLDEMKRQLYSQEMDELRVDRLFAVYQISLEPSLEENIVRDDLTALRNIFRFCAPRCKMLCRKVSDVHYLMTLIAEKQGFFPDAVHIAAWIEALLLRKPAIQCTVYDDIRAMSHELFADEPCTDTVVQTANEYMRLHLTENISQVDIAKAVYLNPEYFSRYYRKKTGHSYRAYLMEIRMNLAMELIRSGMRIKQVCEKVGYSDLNYFTVIFRQYTGLTPTEYRRSPTKKVIPDEKDL